MERRKGKRRGVGEEKRRRRDEKENKRGKEGGKMDE